jgi:hypothetical protein
MALRIKVPPGRPTPADAVTIAKLAARKKLPEEFLREQGVEDLQGGGVAIPYYSEDGGEVLFARERDVPGGPRFRQPAGVKLHPYGLWKLADRDQSVTLAITEGESDCWALWHVGVPALGLPGSNTAGCLQAEHLVGVERLYLVPDNDDGGKTFLDGALRRLGEIGYTGRAFRVEVPRAAKDVGDVHAGDPAGFASRWMQMVADAASLLVPGKAHERNGRADGSGGFGSFGRSGKCRVDLAAPKECRPFVPFPTGSLPHPLVCVVEEGAAALGCDESYIALPVLSVVAAAIGNSRSIQLKSSWYEPSIIWTGVIGDSGTLKTPAFKYALAPAYAVQRQFREEFAKAVARYEAEHADTPKPDKPPRPVQRRAYCSDVTIEKLAQLLEENPKGLLVARDELSGWLGSFQKYKAKNAGSDLPNWLELFAAGCVTVDRKTGERTHVSVEHAAASVTGGIQPKVLGRILAGDYFECGLAARMLLAWPPRRVKVWSDAEVSEGTTQVYEKLLRDLHALTMRQASESRFVPHRRKLSPAAKQVWVNFFSEFAREQAEAEGDMAAALSKLEGYAARFSLVHHIVTHLGLDTHDDRDISPASVEAGVTLAKWFAQETRRVYAALKESDAERNARRLIEWLRSRPEQATTARDLRRSSPGKYPGPEDAEEALDALAEMGLGVWENNPSTELGGRPTRRFRLELTIAKTDETPEGGDDA